MLKLTMSMIIIISAHYFRNILDRNTLKPSMILKKNTNTIIAFYIHVNIFKHRKC